MVSSGAWAGHCIDRWNFWAGRLRLPNGSHGCGFARVGWLLCVLHFPWASHWPAMLGRYSALCVSRILRTGGEWQACFPHWPVLPRVLLAVTGRFALAAVVWLNALIGCLYVIGCLWLVGCVWLDACDWLAVCDWMLVIGWLCCRLQRVLGVSARTMFRYFVQRNFENIQC